jgi:hypothetical protein
MKPPGSCKNQAASGLGRHLHGIVNGFSLDQLEPIERVHMQHDDDPKFLLVDDFAVE